MGSIPKMGKRQAVSVDAFYALLDAWFRTTNEATVGDIINNAGADRVACLFRCPLEKKESQ
ncbi:MAG: hypothetical protein KC656_10630 [Myxococcales bacterium]|nr:hypothetical protein [Myxococcales bacterium]